MPAAGLDDLTNESVVRIGRDRQVQQALHVVVAIAQAAGFLTGNAVGDDGAVGVRRGRDFVIVPKELKIEFDFMPLMLDRSLRQCGPDVVGGEGDVLTVAILVIARRVSGRAEQQVDPVQRRAECGDVGTLVGIVGLAANRGAKADFFSSFSKSEASIVSIDRTPPSAPEP